MGSLAVSQRMGPQPAALGKIGNGKGDDQDPLEKPQEQVPYIDLPLTALIIEGF
jgi:hypothetical protein